LDNASSYEERSELRRALRKLKSGQDNRKKVGSSNYRRAGYQAQISLAIPNSVTGNVLPNKVQMENITKVEVPQTKATISYLKANRSPSTSGAGTKRGGNKRGDSVSSYTSESGINGRKVRWVSLSLSLSLCVRGILGFVCVELRIQGI